MSAVQDHPLGYRKVNLVRFAGWRLRLHIWRGRLSEAPHDHRWSFVGVPLLGRFADTRWVAGSGSECLAVTAWPSTAPGGRSYADTAVVDLVEQARFVRRPLRPYRCSRGQIHSMALVGRGPHVSLVLLAPARSESSTVWFPEESA